MVVPWELQDGLWFLQLLRSSPLWGVRMSRDWSWDLGSRFAPAVGKAGTGSGMFWALLAQENPERGPKPVSLMWEEHPEALEPLQEPW